MSFFSNPAVNRINLHYAVSVLAQASGGGFYLAFLIKAGFAPWAALLVMGAIHGGRFLIRPIALPLGRWLGLRGLLMAGSVWMGVQYPILAHVNGLGAPLVALVFVASFGDVLYWPAYHAYFAVVGDAHSRGSQVGVREASGALIGVVAPLAAAFGLTRIGAGPTFLAIGAVQAAAAVALVGAPQIPVADTAPGALRASSRGVALFFADGWLNAGLIYVWWIALFLAVGQSYAVYGGAQALAAVLAAAGSLFLGRIVDLGHGRRAVLASFAGLIALIFARAAAAQTGWAAVITNAPGPLVFGMWIPAWMSPLYNAAKTAPCPFRFHLAAEAGWDAGAVAGLAAAALALRLGAPIGAGVALAALGAAATLAWVRPLIAERTA